jgi:hypothetical protein
MKTKIYISITLLFISSFSIAQKFKTSVTLSSGISWYNFNHSEVNNKKIGFGYAGTIREEYYFQKPLSLGMELSYLNTNGSFDSPTPSVNAIPEIHSIFQHSLSIHSFDIPIFLRLRTNNEMTKGIYFYCGIGINYIFQTNRTIDIMTTYDYSPDKKDISTVTKGTTTLKKQNNIPIGTIGLFGFGKYFLIKNRIFLCEVKYKYDLNNWIYPTVNDPVNSKFNIKRRCLLLNLGMTF